MSVFSQLKGEENIDENLEISQFLTPELCEEAGIIVIDIEDNTLSLGAMNLDYIKVKKVINTIESKFNLGVNLKQITSLEWETWFENTHSVSVETIQKKSISNDPIQISDFSKVENEDNNQVVEIIENPNDELNDIEEIEEEINYGLIDDANDEALIKLAQANMGDD